MTRLIVLLATAGAAAGAVYGAAAGLGGLTAQNVAAESADIVACDANGISVNWNRGNPGGAGDLAITGVGISHLDDDCAGKFLYVQFARTDGTNITSWGPIVLPSPLTGGGPDDRTVAHHNGTGPRVQDVARVTVEISDPPVS